MSPIAQIDPPVAIRQAIESASKLTGAGFDYLVKTAYRESAFKPGANASTSSAAGLFQFIENTWLGTLKEAGGAFGLGEHASKIRRLDTGRYAVTDPSARSEILNLRYDPRIAAVMAGVFTQQNAEFLGEALGRDPSGGELYIAHFLGPGKGARLIKAAGEEPNAVARDYFPKAARANKPIFYHNGQPRSMAEVYRVLVQKHDSEIRAPAAVPNGEERSTQIPAAQERSVPAMAAAATGLLEQVSSAVRSFGSKPAAPWLVGLPKAGPSHPLAAGRTDHPENSRHSGALDERPPAPGSIGTWAALVERAIAEAGPMAADPSGKGKGPDQGLADAERRAAKTAERSSEPAADVPAQRRSNGVLVQVVPTGERFGAQGFDLGWLGIMESA